MKEEKFKKCPRCEKKILKSKSICSFCGTVFTEKQIDKTDKLLKQTSKKKEPCPICGKPSEGQTVCPNCGIEGICSFHIYKFYSGQVNSPEGCPKCGPRCSTCDAQTSLVVFRGRSLCTPCADHLRSPKFADKDKQKEDIEKVRTIITTILTFLGLGIGIYLGVYTDMHKALTGILKIPVFKGIIVTIVWGLMGLIAGSILASIVNLFIRTD
ncbi:MAG: hypothetical protein K8T10_00950 [Candidatus Eremiobacteraeota bacterium]|nr:hypothetical protein [Candidatus Eremiobacteraeota bacterium]